MKHYQALPNCRSTPALLAMFALLLLASGLNAFATDDYWSGNSGGSWNIDQSGNWFNGGCSGVPCSGDNLYFNNTGNNCGASGIKTPYCNYGAGAYFGYLITYGCSGGITWEGNETYLLKFENQDTTTLTGQAALANRTGPDSDLQINPVNGQITLTGGVVLQNGKQLIVYGGNTLNVNTTGISQSGSGSATLAIDGVVGGVGTTVILNAASSFAGDTYLNNGTLRVTVGSVFSGTTTLRLGDTANANTENAYLNVDGGITFASPVFVRSGNSGAHLFGNSTTGTSAAIYSGNLTLNASATSYANSQGPVTLSGTTLDLQGNTLTVDGAGNTTVSGTLQNTTGSGSLVKNGTGALTLSGANTYSGNTTISAGTLVLSGSGSIASSPNLTVASGATLDVSGLSTALALGSGQTLTVSATGANTTGTIKMGSSKGLTLSAGGLTFTAYGGGSTAPLTAGTAGSLNLNGVPITVTTTTALAAGTYTLIAATGGTVAGSPGTLNINGSGIAAYTTASVAVSSGALVLTVTATALVKADNATPLDQAGSWVGNAVPGSTEPAIWDGTLSAADSTNSAGTSTLNVGQIQIKSPSGGVPVSITGSSAWWRLYGVNGADIDMSQATVDLVIGPGFTVQSFNSASYFTNQTGRTLTISGGLYVGSSGGKTLTLDGGGNYVLSSPSGNLTGGGTLIKQGAGAVTITTPNYNTNFVLNAGTFNVNQNFAINGNANSFMTINGGTIDNTSGGAIGLTANTPSYFWNGDFTFAGTGNLNLGSGAVTLGGNRQVTCNANTLTVGGVISDGGSGYSLTKAGAGTLTLSGASTYSGGTLINAGTLALSGTGSIANSPNLTVASAATLDVSGLSTALAPGSGQTLKASATGANTTGTIKMGASAGLKLSAGGLTFTAYGGGSTAPLTAGTAGSLNLNGAPITVTTTTALATGTYTLIAASGGSVTGTPGTLTVNGSGLAANTAASVAVSSGALVLTVAATAQVKADNATSLDQGGSWVSGTAPTGSQWAIWNGTYTPVNLTNAIQASVTWGGIQISNVSPIGGPIAITNYNNNYSMNLNGIPNGGGGVGIDMSSATVDLSIASYRVYIPNNESFNVTSGRTLSLLNNLQLQSYTLTLNGAGNYKIPGQVYGASSSAGALVMNGTGSLTLGNANYCYFWTNNSGTLNLNHNYAISGNSGQALTINGGTIDATVNGISLAQAPALKLNGDFAFNGTYSLNLGTGAVTLGGNRQVTCNANTLTMGGVISDGSSGYSLTKAGAGTLTLSGANTYSGNTTISAGTLALSGSGSIASSPNITIASGATLSVSGLSTTLALGGGQTLKASATGANTTGTVTMGSSQGLTLSAGGLTYTAYGGGSIAPLTAGGAGSLNLNGAPITVSTTTALAAGTYTLIAASGGTVTGTPGTLTVNGSGIAGFTVASVAVSSGALVLTVTPTAQVKTDNATTLDQGGSWVSGTAPGSSQWAIWNGAYTPSNLTNSLANSATWGGILVSNVSGAPTICTTGSGTLVFNGVSTPSGVIDLDMSHATVDFTLGTTRVNENSTTTTHNFMVAAGRTFTFGNITSPWAWNINSVGTTGAQLMFSGAGNYVFTGQFYDNNPGGGSLNFNGPGTVTLANANYVQHWTLNGGTLNLNQAYAINAYSGSTLTISNGTIDNTSGGAITLGNAPSFNWNGDFTFAGTGNLNLGSGAVTLGGNRQVTVNANTLTVGGVIGDGASGYSLTKPGAGILTLSGANTYSGNTTISAGRLALSGMGSIANTPNIVIAGGAALDVSALISPFTLGSQTLSNSAVRAVICGTNNTGSGTVSLVYDGVNPSFIVTNGGMALSAATTFKVNNTGSALGVGSYLIISNATAGTTGLVAGTAPSSVIVNGGGIAAGTTASLQIASAGLNLVVKGNQVIGFTNGLATLTRTYGAPVFADAATNSTGLTLSYASDNGGVATVDGNGNVTILATGSCHIIATNSGSASYNPASALQTLVITSAAPVIQLAASIPGTNGYGSSLTFTSTLPAFVTSGNVIFLTNSAAFSTNGITNGVAYSLAITNLPRGTNTISVQYAGNLPNVLGSTNSLVQVVTNHPPVAAVLTVTRTAGLRLLIPLFNLSTNWNDVDGDTLELTGVNMQSTNGVSLEALNWTTNVDGSIATTNSAAYLGYTNSPNVNDQISYAISDGQGGTNVGYINIVIQLSVTGTNSITGITTGSTNVVNAYGLPGYTYILERATNLASPVWIDIATNTAASNGVINAADSFWDLGWVPPSSAFYQLKWQP